MTLYGFEEQLRKKLEIDAGNRCDFCPSNEDLCRGRHVCRRDKIKKKKVEY